MIVNAKRYDVVILGHVAVMVNTAGITVNISSTEACLAVALIVFLGRRSTINARKLRLEKNTLRAAWLPLAPNAHAGSQKLAQVPGMAIRIPMIASIGSMPAAPRGTVAIMRKMIAAAPPSNTASDASPATAARAARFQSTLLSRSLTLTAYTVCLRIAIVQGRVPEGRLSACHETK